MWRSRIFWRLFAAYSLLLAVSLGLLGWMLIGRIETHLLEEIQRSLETKTLLVRELVTRLNHDALQEQMTRLATETESRITLISADGTVLADSNERPEAMENHKGRPEVQEAARSGLGVSTRFSGTVHQPMMYVARRSDSGPVGFVRIALPLDTVAREIGWSRRVVWSGALITLLLALVLSLVIARRLTAPLVELAQAAKSISRDGCGPRVHIQSHDEIGALAGAFNEMTEACASHIAQMDEDRQRLRAVFRSMVEGVLVIDADHCVQFVNDAAGQFLAIAPASVQGRKLWQLVRHRQLGEAVETILASDEPHHCELEWTGSEPKVYLVHGARLPGERLRGAVLVFHDITPLRKLERVRQDFVANVSHELKTPLAAIQATVETLLDGAIADPDHNIRFLERIRENADRLHRLVQDLLTLGRIESGEEVMDMQPISLGDAVEACLARQRERAKTGGLQLEQAPFSEPAHALADEEALAEILDNLVDNAIKYTPAGGKISVRWSSDGVDSVIRVTDTGVGIPEKDLTRIFERFYRVDKARSRELGGTGLGLSIVKHLVQALGGSITAESQLGKGSVFTVRLPAAREEAFT